MDKCNNIKYLTNESIVNGIRNSIAHGNYRVIFMGELSKSKIIFDDIYEGKLTFHGEISILDFINMIANNLIVILSFIEKTEILKKYTMVIVLVFVVIMFSVNTKGVMLLPQNVNNLVAQNAYVFILATGMLFCILTGGNIDLSVGSVVCFVVR